MAKEVKAKIKLQIPGGGATPAPPVGSALGQHQVNIMELYPIPIGLLILLLKQLLLQSL